MIVREKKEALARDVLRLAEGSIQRKLPAFGAALGVMEGEWTARGSGTDVQKLYWNREEVFRLFREGLEQVERRYLHLLLHGMYLHGLRGRELPERVWWLACDLMTEYRIDRMHVPGFAWPIPGERSRWYRRLQEEGAVLQERKLAEWLGGWREERLQELEDVFRRDDHVYWREEDAVGEEGRTERQERAEKMRKTAGERI